MTLPTIHGTAAPGFEPVAQAFAANFADHAEVGASLALVQDGVLKVDLWGGYRDAARTLPWTADTLANVWSTTKGVTALCFAMLVDRGQIDYDAPVARYWPEFGVAGKSAVTVAMLLSHQAGLSGFATPARSEDYYDFEAAADRLATQAPFWEPGTASGYHAISIGALANGLFRRVEGRSLARFVAEEFAAKHALDLAIGLPAAWEDRAAEMIAMESRSVDEAAIPDLSPAQFAALANPPVDPLQPNSAGWRRAEIPSANGFANARALAALYGALANRGMLGKTRLLSPEAIAAATAERIRGMDLVLSIPAVWGAGFLRSSDGLYGPSPDAFGHSGWGGSFAFADPGVGIGFAYVMNRMGGEVVGDPRDTALVEAVYRSTGVTKRLASSKT